MKVKILDRNNEVKNYIDSLKIDIEYSDHCDLLIINADYCSLDEIHKYHPATTIVLLETVNFLHPVLALNLNYVCKKPLDLEYFNAIFMHIYNTLNDQIIVTCRRRKQCVPCQEISYIASDKRIIQIEMKDGTNIECYGKLDDIEALLPNYFVRIHKSYIVNYHDINRVSDLTIELQSYPYSIYISRSKREYVNQRLNELKHIN